MIQQHLSANGQTNCCVPDQKNTCMLRFDFIHQELTVSSGLYMLKQYKCLMSVKNESYFRIVAIYYILIKKINDYDDFSPLYNICFRSGWY